jgi:arylsulfate sulfotransferase
MRSIVLTLTLTLSLLAGSHSRALTFTTQPTFVPASEAPLAGVLQVSTDLPSRVSVTVTDGTTRWRRDFLDYATVHVQTLAGFKAGRTNMIAITVYDRYRNSVAASQPVTFVTAPLPADFPKSVLWTNQPAKMEPGYTLLRLYNLNTQAAYITMLDQGGEVVWYSTVASTLDVRQLANGDLFIPLTTSFTEINLLGQTVNAWSVPNGLAINFHDGVPTPHNSILYLNDDTRVVPNFPTSATDPNAPTATTEVLYNRVVEMSSTDSSQLNLWPLIDMLQANRIDYLTFSLGDVPGWDCEHANAVIEDPSDNSIIVSMRHQDAVVKFSRATGQLKWILGPHENWDARFQPFLLTPVGTPFEWNYAQHAPTLTPQGTLLLYDDGNFRASPFAPGVPDASNHSRAVEFAINEQTMEVSQVWDYGRTNADRLYTDRVGNAEWLPQKENVLVTYGYTLYENGKPPRPNAPAAPMVRIKEVTHTPNPEVVFDLAFCDYANTNSGYLGYFTYRSHRVPDLYSVLPMPVQDLTVQFNQDTALLQFTGRPTGSYAVQASNDLANWEEIGTATNTGDGEFSYTDLGASPDLPRYYRVMSR